MTQLFILIDHMSFETDEIRELLISTLTMVMVSLIDDAYIDGDGNTNCYQALPGQFCNVPSMIRINLPNLDGSKEGNKNQLHVNLAGTKVYGNLGCCGSRFRVDRNLDLMAQPMSRIFNQPFKRLVSCMVGGWTTCEQCCERYDCNKCNKCGFKCQKLD